MITRKAEYAIIILTELATQPAGNKITSKKIAENQSIPVNLVAQLLTLLREAGWTSGTRGPKGGISLVADPAKINLRQVIELVDGHLGITRCLFSEKPCRGKRSCSLREVWIKAQANMISVLENVTIKDLSESGISHQ
jgi:Rrf2 family protein